MEKWRSIAAGMSCLSMLFATGAVTVSASDEITEIPEQSIVYWSMWEEDEPQADVIREAAEAYEEATGISVEIQWKGRGIRSLIEPALDAGEQIDLFDDDYQRMAQEHRDYLAELKGMADTVDYEQFFSFGSTEFLGIVQIKDPAVLWQNYRTCHNRACKGASSHFINSA